MLSKRIWKRVCPELDRAPVLLTAGSISYVDGLASDVCLNLKFHYWDLRGTFETAGGFSLSAHQRLALYGAIKAPLLTQVEELVGAFVRGHALPRHLDPGLSACVTIALISAGVSFSGRNVNSGVVEYAQDVWGMSIYCCLVGHLDELVDAEK
jgi:hypothetical protein